MYQIPKYVFLEPVSMKEMKIAQYDVAAEKWCLLPNDTVVEYDVAQKRVVCKISRPEPIAYVQSRNADFPYVAWELRSVEKGVVWLDLELKRYFLVPEGQEEK